MTEQPPSDTPIQDQVRRESRQLQGWGAAIRTRCELVSVPADEAIVAEVIDASGARGCIGRGAGRSYGDSSLNGGGTVIAVDPGYTFDRVHGTIDSTAGTSIDELYRAIAGSGWSIPVTAGTRHITVAGAIAADVHGKNHHLDGSFSRHVAEITMVDGTGTTRCVLPGSDEFNATVGGMGLTGVIVRARLALMRTPSNYLRVHTTKHHNFSSVVETLDTDTSHFNVAWIDLSRGRHSGRGVITSGEWTEHAGDAWPGGLEVSIPVEPRWSLVNRWSVQAFNEAWWRKTAQQSEDILHLSAFFHPLDGVANWGRLYGKAGFLQYQFVVPAAALHTLEKIVADIIARGIGTPMVVLKKFGEGNDAPLSFPIPGWTLAVDVPSSEQGLSAVLRHYDEMVCEAGGRVYLAKDAEMHHSTFRAMYPALPQWEQIQAGLDPYGRFNSDQARRLQLGVAARQGRNLT